MPPHPPPPCTGTRWVKMTNYQGPGVQDWLLPSSSSLYQLSSVTMGRTLCLVLGTERQVRCSPSSEAVMCQVMTAWHHLCQDSSSLSERQGSQSPQSQGIQAPLTLRLSQRNERSPNSNLALGRLPTQVSAPLCLRINGILAARAASAQDLSPGHTVIIQV